MAKKKTRAEEPTAVVVVPKKELVLEGDPEAQLEFAHKAASTLMKWVGQKKNPVMIRGEQYLEFGDWQILARFYGATLSTEWTHPVEKGGRTWGYEARMVVLRDGLVLASAENMCTRDEKRWAGADEYAIRSMAQTRAGAKALRNAFGWVAELAGYKSTPAEEMPYDRTPVPDSTPVILYGADEGPTIPSDTIAQKKMLFSILKKRGVDVSDKAACERFVGDETQLALVDGNLAEIIRQLL